MRFLTCPPEASSVGRARATKGRVSLRERSRWLYSTTLVAFAAAVVAVPGALAAPGHDLDKIHSCVNRSSGNLRIIYAPASTRYPSSTQPFGDPSATCGNNEQEIDWAGGGAR